MNEFVKRMGYVHVRLDGGTAVKERQKIVDDFNHEAVVSFVSHVLRSWVSATNIASANKVIIFDPCNQNLKRFTIARSRVQIR